MNYDFCFPQIVSPCFLNTSGQSLTLLSRAPQKQWKEKNRCLASGALMCQHYSGHTVTQLYAEFRTRRATNSDSQNEFFHDYKRPQYIQILTA